MPTIKIKLKNPDYCDGCRILWYGYCPARAKHWRHIMVKVKKWQPGKGIFIWHTKRPAECKKEFGK